jgi:3-phosphoshikimate 1-carboxyvinyltransferase
MRTILLQRPNRDVQGAITLAGSKSISNRALMIRALCEQPFEITHLANAKDTQLLAGLLDSDNPVRDAGAAGTTFRFMTAYLATQPGTQTLTGTERMKQRPIGVLVDALRELGADITYLENEGYPPLRIGEPRNFGAQSSLHIAANTSSQYISALLMLAPTLPNGLELTLTGKIVSRSYIEMTLSLMAHFGIAYTWEGQSIRIAPQSYQPKPYRVEADWSAASYYYAIAAFAERLDLQLNGLFEKSVQGDAVIVDMMDRLGIVSTFNESGVHLSKKAETTLPGIFEWDFILCPDIAQTMAVINAGLGVESVFTGLETLRIKETDRIAALQNELKKIAVGLIELPARFSARSKQQYYMVNGKAAFAETPTFPTYEDHRMAMAFAPLAMLHPIQIEEPEVVVKSYPDFWKDLEAIGFVIGQ